MKADDQFNIRLEQMHRIIIEGVQTPTDLREYVERWTEQRIVDEVPKEDRDMVRDHVLIAHMILEEQ